MSKLIMVYIAVFTMFCVRAANEGVDGIYWYYEVYSDRATIYNESGGSAIAKSIAGDIEVPSKIGGYPVKGIGYKAFGGCKLLTSVLIPDGVSGMAASVFAMCSSLKKVTIPDSMRRIGGSAFVDCSLLEDVGTLSSVTNIGAYAFSGCNKLTSATFLNTSNWDVDQFLGPASGYVPAYDLSIKSTAARYLISTYCAWVWTRNV